MAATNSLVKEQRKKLVDEGPISLAPDLLAKLHAAASPPGADACVAAFAAAVPAAAALPSAKTQAMAVKDLVQQAVDRTAAGEAGGTDDPASAMLRLLCDVVLSPGTRPLHKPLLGGLKALSPPYLAFIHSYISGNLADAVSRSAGGGGGGGAGEQSSVAAAHLIYVAESLLMLQEHRPAVAPCAVPLTAHVVDSLEAAVAAATAAAESAGAVSYPLAEAVNERVAALYLLITQLATFIAAGEAAGEAAEGAEGGESGAAACVCRAADCLLTILEVGTLTRECMAAAASALCAAAAMPAADPAAVVAEVASGLLLEPGTVARSASPVEQGSWVATGLRRRGTSLAAELRRLRPFPALCMLRGLLQGSPVPALAAPLTLAHAASASGEEAAGEWAVLTQGAMVTLSHAVRASPDANFKNLAIHTLTVCMDRLLQQWDAAAGGSSKKAKKKAAAAAAAAAPPPSRPAALSPDHQRLVLSVMWASWDDGTTQAARLSLVGFRQLLRLVEAQGAGAQDFFASVARDLLALEPAQKRRYAPLAALVPHLGGGALVALRPGLVAEALGAMAGNRTACSPAAGLLSALWGALREEAAAAAGGDAAAAAAAWRAHWAPPLAAALCSADDRTRRVACTYAVPAIAELDPGAISVLLAEVAHADPDVAAAAAVGLLSAGRKLSLVGDLDAVALPVTPSSGPSAGPDPLDVRALLARAVASRSEVLRATALGLLCMHPRNTTLPPPWELDLVLAALSVDMHTTSASARQNTVAPLGRLLTRIRIAAGAALTRPRDFPPGAAEAVAACAAWLRRLAAGAAASMHPGAQYGRRYMAVETLCMLLEVFGDLLVADTDGGGGGGGGGGALGEEGEDGGDRHQEDAESGTDEKKGGKKGGDGDETTQASAARSFRRKGPLAAMRKGDGAAGARLSPASFQPWPPGFAGRATVDALLAACLDPWDRIREGAAEALILLPAPLPGMGCPADAARLLRRGLAFLGSPRLKDADAGARIVALVFQQAVLGLGWRAGVHPPVAYAPIVTHPGARNAAAVDFLATLVALVADAVGAGEADLAAASRSSLAHGPLLALRYALAVAPWGELAGDAAAWAGAQGVVARALGTLQRLNDLVLPVLSTPEEMTAVGAADVDVLGPEGGDSGGCGSSESEDKVLGPEAQVVTCACWMNAKELALVLGTLCQAAPLVATRSPAAAAGGAGSAQPPPLLPPAKVAAAAEMLLTALIESKHNGAVEKTQQGLEALASTVMGADPAATALPLLPPAWLNRLLTHMRRPGQSLRDIVRRSAGLPPALLALLRARPAGGARPLAARGLAELLATAGDAAAATEPWPRVHAFNALRAAFLDTELTPESQPFRAEGLRVAIAGLAAPQWEVRNAAMLCFTALLVRVLGFANMATRDAWGKRSATAADFFAAYPSLHPFLLAQLRRAAEDLEADGAEGRGLHPSLSPILTLLMRLAPESAERPAASEAPGAAALGPIVGSGAVGEDERLPALLQIAGAAPGVSYSGSDGGSSGTEISPEAFIPLVQRCAARPMFVRMQAAKALPPLVPAEAVPEVAGRLAAAVAAALRRRAPWDANRLQGQIMQLDELLRVLVDVPAADDSAEGAAARAEAALAAVCPPLAPCAAACAAGRYPCAPVSHAFLRLAQTAAAVAVGAGRAGAAAPLVQAAAGHAWRGVADAAVSDSSADGNIMLGVALKEATLLRLLWLPLLRCAAADAADAAGDQSQDWAAEVAEALQHRRSEVRGSALKAALRLLGEGALPAGAGAAAALARAAVLSPADVAALRAVLGIHLREEAHPKCLRRTLHALALLPLRPVAAAADAAEAGLAAELFTEVLSHAQGGTDPTARQHALAALGGLLAAAAPAPAGAAEREAAVAALAAEFSDGGQLPDLRAATAAMLRASGLLACSGGGNEDAVSLEPRLAAWEAALRLMEDEEVGIRDEAAAAAAEAMACWPGAPPLRDAAAEGVYGAAPGALAARLGTAPPLVRLLRRLACDVEAAEEELAGVLASAAAGAAAASGRLFEIEKDNHHEEPVARVQLAARALGLGLGGRGWPAAAAGEAAATLRWGRNAALALRAASKSPGWAAMHGFEAAAEMEAAFQPAYSLILAIWAAGRCRGASTGGEGARYGAETAATVRKMVRSGAFATGLGAHPQLRAAWAAAAQAWGGPAEGAGAAAAHALLWQPTGFLANFAVAPESEEEEGLLRDLEAREAASAAAAAARAQGRPGIRIPAIPCSII